MMTMTSIEGLLSPQYIAVLLPSRIEAIDSYRVSPSQQPSPLSVREVPTMVRESIHHIHCNAYQHMMDM